LLIPPGKVMSLLGRLAVLVLLLVLGPRAGLAAECRPIAEFGRYTVGEFPDDWKPKEERAREIYKVLEQGGVRFIRATARSTGLQVGKEFDWDLEAFPALAWKWRPQLFPHGADERDSARNDSVLGVYAVFPHSPVAVKTVKYVWSATVPAGTTASASRGLTRMIVIRSGERVDGKWVQETANVAQDYARLFGEPPKQPRGVALLTDADDTKNAAAGDYADLRVCAAEGATSSQQEDARPAPKAPTPTPAKPAKPAGGKRAEKPQAPAKPAAVVEERTPPVDRPPIRYSRPAAVTPAFEPEKR
jgi:hypothetical protein